MDGEIITWIFLIGGMLLMILETLLPGGVAFFLGLSGLGVGVLRYLGFLSDPLTAMMIWLFSSVGLTIAIRPFIKKYFRGETSYKFADEDYEAIDQVVDVVEPISDENNLGRIRFNGISWSARTVEGTIRAGEKARISYRVNTTWIVEPLNPDQQALDQQLKEITD
ncbi:MAG: NfeD family protein [Balneolaceae bacterium]